MTLVTLAILAVVIGLVMYLAALVAELATLVRFLIHGATKEHPRRPKGAVMKSRPAETGGVAGAMALLIARIAGITDADTIVALGIVVGFIPAGITWLVALRQKPKQ